jgi:hypothetical protein
MMMMDSAIETGQLLATSVEIMSKTAALNTRGCPATKLACGKCGKNDDSNIGDLLGAVDITNMKSLDSFEVISYCNASKRDQRVVRKTNDLSVSVHE